MCRLTDRLHSEDTFSEAALIVISNGKNEDNRHDASSSLDKSSASKNKMRCLLIVCYRNIRTR